MLEYLVTYNRSATADYIEVVKISNVRFISSVQRKVWYKTDTINIVDIYVSILVSLVIFIYLCWYINNKQNSMLDHPMIKKIYIQMLDS